jgi:hypothetical protein
MIKNKTVLTSFISQVLLLAYVAGVSWFMNNAQYFFDEKPGIIGGVLFLFLFVFSALISGMLVLGGPIYLYWEKEKKTAAKMLSFNILFIAMIMFAILLFLTR